MPQSNPGVSITRPYFRVQTQARQELYASNRSNQFALTRTSLGSYMSTVSAPTGLLVTTTGSTCRRSSDLTTHHNDPSIFDVRTKVHPTWTAFCPTRCYTHVQVRDFSLVVRTLMPMAWLATVCSFTAAKPFWERVPPIILGGCSPWTAPYRMVRCALDRQPASLDVILLTNRSEQGSKKHRSSLSQSGVGGSEQGSTSSGYFPVVTLQDGGAVLNVILHIAYDM